ncbi:2-oxo-4-hydroxy-4-carboxy-5-ureidoimidazoline decarboxylase [Mycolicibacterium pyrenivorans]|uniref:2-oxo-4-hydroxy-4-carboxy-5-ureidoimidazoline decarboxylase n=1 Tax=Mycolicibacterium pyrenivorans TaxID=187102 RepID=UPI0021F36B05|nr:2-oxo-4-hydroxy-4-carboxy-5-ureidoimidazoline decarboxylase [Mycolicibacterium pyrenivorans]MCV7150930.1 2-oxo-4-hydroxy-4-carboxy-5-ureidoimidazoline decarboxylase [Mycolicibacterium pyrenivorans]
MAGSLDVEEFNRLSEQERMRLLSGVCASPVWARRVLEGGPFPDADALFDRADQVLADLPDTGLAAALDGHPRIGADPDNPASEREQTLVAGAGDAVKAELAAEGGRYEDKFGYVYLVCASGRTAEELLAILTGRLDNDPETERRVVRSELAKINRLRLQRLMSKENP